MPGYPLSSLPTYLVQLFSGFAINVANPADGTIVTRVAENATESFLPFRHFESLLKGRRWLLKISPRQNLHGTIPVEI
jgi:hypothetical protein